MVKAEADDAMSATWFANYSFGPVSVGYQKAGLDHGINAAATAATSAKTIAAAGGFFESEMMSIAFNVNENLSISYGELTETYNAQSNHRLEVKLLTLIWNLIQFSLHTQWDQCQSKVIKQRQITQVGIVMQTLTQKQKSQLTLHSNFC